MNYTFWGKTYCACFPGSVSLSNSEEMITYTSSFSLSSGWTICPRWWGMRTENAFSSHICTEWAAQMSGTKNRCETELKEVGYFVKKMQNVDLFFFSFYLFTQKSICDKIFKNLYFIHRLEYSTILMFPYLTSQYFTQCMQNIHSLTFRLEY